MKYYDKLIFELSKKGRVGYSLPANRFPAAPELPVELRRETPPDLPEVSEADVVRHYTNLSQMNFGVDSGFYPLGSCTMKYNPKINEEVAALPGFAGLHPLMHAGLTKGALKVYEEMNKALCAITGMEAFTFDPCAGAPLNSLCPVTSKSFLTACHARFFRPRGTFSAPSPDASTMTLSERISVKSR